MGVVQFAFTYWPGILICGIFVHLLRNYLYNGLQKVPGPWFRAISPLPRIWSVYSGRSHIHDLELHRKYGNVVRIAPTMLSISDPSELDKIYGISTDFYKSQFFEPTRVYDDEGIIPDPFILADKRMHSRMKRNAANAYSLSALVQLEPLVDPIIKRLCTKLSIYARASQPCDLGEFLQFFAFDAIFTVTFGKDLRFIEDGDPKGWLKSMSSGLVYIAVMGQIPWAHKCLMALPFVQRLVEGDPSEGFFPSAMRISGEQFHAFKEKITTVDSESGPSTFLQRLLRNQQQNPASITDREVNTHTFGNIIAGSDTTAVGLRAVIIHLMKNPDAYKKLCMEIRDAQPPFPVPWPLASKLPYLEACVKEAMRLHPSVGMILPRAVPVGGATLCGHKIAAGIEVGINPWVVHRNELAFPEPERFLPQRWLTATKEQAGMANKCFFAFGGGRHTCSGQHISVLEIRKLIPSLLLKFDLEWATENDGVGVETSNYFFTLQRGLMVRLRARDDGSVPQDL